MFNNKTKNQHYVAQVEQKLNSIDINVNKAKRRIYEFEILNHETEEFRLTKTIGVKISENLSLDDLYSFEIFENNTRDNFEYFFNGLEHQIENLSNKILESNTILKDDLINFFCAKFLNMLRNPFCIVKILNTFGDLCNYSPTDPKTYNIYKKIDALNVNKNLLLNLNVTSEQYKNWLKIIFLMIVPLECNENSQKDLIMRKICFNFFDFEKNLGAIFLCTYDKPSCLLSDRGYIEMNTNNSNDTINFTFNISKYAFISFYFVHGNNLKVLSRILNLSQTEIRNLQKSEMYGIKMPLEIQKFTNNKLLEIYNINVIAQSYKNFYASFIYNNALS